jgi:hypothetical protein
LMVSCSRRRRHRLAFDRGRPGCVDHGDHRHHANLEMLGQIGLVVLGRRAYEGWRRPGRARTARWPGS